MPIDVFLGKGFVAGNFEVTILSICNHVAQPCELSIQGVFPYNGLYREASK